MGPVEQEEELLRSKVVLETHLGRRVEVFAFPYGDNGGNPQESAKTLEKVGFRAACVYGGGPNPLPVADTYRLNRVAMGPDTDLRTELEQK